MRYKDIKIAESKQNKIVEFVQNPDLAKPEQMDMNQILDFIDTQSDNADPKLLQIVTKGLDKLKGYFKNKVEKVNPDALKDQPTNETLADAIDTQINDVNFMREQVKQAGGDPDDEKALEFARNLAKMLLPKGAQIGHESLNKIKAEIEQLYAPLAKKIVDGGSVFAPVVSEDDDDDATAIMSNCSSNENDSATLQETSRHVMSDDNRSRQITTPTRHKALLALFERGNVEWKKIPTKTLNENVAWVISDSGATGHFVVEGAPVINKQPATNPITITLPSGSTIRSTHTCNLDIPWLPHHVTKARIIPGLAHSSLIST